MSILSNSAFITSQFLNSNGYQVKRSHIFEIYAAYMGFKSYASLSEESFIDRLRIVRCEEYSVIFQRVTQRLKELNLPFDLTDSLLNSINDQLEVHFFNSNEKLYNNVSSCLLLNQKNFEFNHDHIRKIKDELEILVENHVPTACFLSLAWRYAELHADDFFDGVGFGQEERGIFLYDLSEKKFSDWKKNLTSSSDWGNTSSSLYRDSVLDKINEISDFNEHPLKKFLSVEDIPAPNVIDVIDSYAIPNFYCNLLAGKIVNLLTVIYSSEFSKLDKKHDQWIVLAIIQNPRYSLLEYLYNWFYGSNVKRYAIYLFGLENNIDISLLNKDALKYSPSHRITKNTRLFIDPELDCESDNIYYTENHSVEQCNYFELSYREGHYGDNGEIYELDYSLLNSNNDKNNNVFLSLPQLSDQELIESKRIAKALRKIQMLCKE